MNYAEAIAHLHALVPELASPLPNPDGTLPPRRKFDLAHMRVLAAALGNPQDRVPAILIAGTNGKGSTAATLASILTAAGYRTGLYTSPHLLRVNERIQLAHPVLPSEYGSSSVRGSDGELALEPIADDDFARLYTLVDEAATRLVHAGDLPFLPSFFERLTAVAFACFGSADLGSSDKAPALPRAEIMVLEVGLGGRLDATNIVQPVVSVITDIALDHQEYLGDTIAAIAAEKCGILREGGTLVTLSQHQEANQAIGEAAERLQVRGIDAAPFLPPAQRNEGVHIATSGGDPLPRNRYSLHVADGREAGLLAIDSPLYGAHQQRNVALALATVIFLRNSKGYDLRNAAIEAGIRNTRWPGRLEFLPPNLLLDVAHNPAGAWALRGALADLPEDRPRTLVFSCLRDKNLAEMSRILFPLFDSSPEGDPLRRRDHIVLAPIANLRAASVDDLLAAAQALGTPAHAAPHAEGALAQARAITPPDGMIVVTGSVYLVGEVRAHAHPEAEVFA